MFPNSTLLPAWIREYRKEDLPFDLVAGLTVGVMMIPQGMAYAMLAGLPPIYGLYAATVPMIVYGFLGSSRHLSVGPVAIDSILTAAAISVLAVAGSEEYISLAITLALMVGLIQFGLGSSRLGFLVAFLSHPVIVGFTSAAAIIIGLSQLKPLLGIDVPSHLYLHRIIGAIVDSGFDIHWVTAAIGLGGIVSLMLLKRYLPRVPGPLLVVTAATILVYFLQLHLQGVSVIGDIPRGVPAPSLPKIDFDACRKLLPAAFAIALVSFMESNAVSRSIQARHKTYKIKPNRELISLGLANLIGSFFKSFPVSGGLSRSVVNDQAGARSNLAAMIAALVVLLAILMLTPLFYYMPTAALAAIILSTIYKLINIKEAKNLWKIDRRDFLMMMVTFFGTLFLGISTGVVIGVLLSLAWIIFEASYPHFAELGRIPGTHSFRNVRRFDGLTIEDGILIFRFDAPLFFANIDRFQDELYIRKSLRKFPVHSIIIDMESINTIDSSSLNILHEMADELSKENIRLIFSEIKGPIRDKFYRSGLTEKLGEQSFFMTTEDAVECAAGRKTDFVSEATLQTNRRKRE